MLIGVHDEDMIKYARILTIMLSGPGDEAYGCPEGTSLHNFFIALHKFWLVWKKYYVIMFT